jgi:hypothetical protein
MIQTNCILEITLPNFDFDDLEACLVAIAKDLDFINLIIMVTIKL